MGVVLITPLAREDLGDIWDYAAESGLGRARHELLVKLRSFTFKNYVIFYQPATDGIEVLRVLHGARDVHRVFDEMVGESNEEHEEDQGDAGQR